MSASHIPETPHREATIEDLRSALAKVRHIENEEEANRIIEEQLQDFTPESIEKAWQDLDLIDRARGARLYELIDTLGYKNKRFPLWILSALIKHPIKLAELFWLGARLMLKGGMRDILETAGKALKAFGREELGE
jgi:hypothetical protein